MRETPTVRSPWHGRPLGTQSGLGFQGIWDLLGGGDFSVVLTLRDGPLWCLWWWEQAAAGGGSALSPMDQGTFQGGAFRAE